LHKPIHQTRQIKHVPRVSKMNAEINLTISICTTAFVYARCSGYRYWRYLRAWTICFP